MFGKYRHSRYADPIIAESYEMAIDMKRRALDRSLCVFVIGILLFDFKRAASPLKC